MSWNERLKQAKESMAKEIAEDDCPQVYERLAMEPCIVRELDRTEQALIAARRVAGLVTSLSVRTCGIPRTELE